MGIARPTSSQGDAAGVGPQVAKHHRGVTGRFPNPGADPGAGPAHLHRDLAPGISRVGPSRREGDQGTDHRWLPQSWSTHPWGTANLGALCSRGGVSSLTAAPGTMAARCQARVGPVRPAPCRETATARGNPYRGGASPARTGSWDFGGEPPRGERVTGIEPA